MLNYLEVAEIATIIEDIFSVAPSLGEKRT
jgi:hypothetical protein